MKVLLILKIFNRYCCEHVNAYMYFPLKTHAVYEIIPCLCFQEPVKRVLGNFHGYRQKGAKRRRVQLTDEVIEVPFLESLEQLLNNPSILVQVK